MGRPGGSELGGAARPQPRSSPPKWFDPDDDVDEDQQSRYSLVWEYMPIQFFQLRAGARIYDGIPQNPNCRTAATTSSRRTRFSERDEATTSDR